jgi:hypothetical protein
MSNYRIKYGIITNRLVETIEMDISFAYIGVRMNKM